MKRVLSALPQNCYLGRVHTKLTKRKHNRNSAFCDKSVTILQHLWNISATCVCFLQLHGVPSPVDKDQKAYFFFCWSCISIYLCTKNQLDALFFPGLFLQSTPTCFGHFCSPSSGGVLCVCVCVCVCVCIYIEQLVRVVYIQYTSW